MESLNKKKLRYLIVGGVSVIIHGYARTTMDLDVWVERSEENSQEASLGDCLVKVVSKRDLIQAKLAAGRHKDLDDVLHLEEKDGD